MKALPSNEEFYQEFKDTAFSMFLIQAQEFTKDEIVKYAADRGLNFPIPQRLDCNFVGYDQNGRVTLPYAYVISPEGKVVFQGKTGYEAEVRKQIARIKYPKLKRLDVAAPVVAAATAFEKGEYVQAREQALKAREANPESSEAVADADEVVFAVDAHLSRMREKIDAAKEARRYHDAIRWLEELQGKPYKGLPGCDTKAEVTELKADKAVKAELKAWDALAKTLEENKKAKDNQTQKTALGKFAKKHEGTAAADEAIKLAEALE